MRPVHRSHKTKPPPPRLLLLPVPVLLDLHTRSALPHRTCYRHVSCCYARFACRGGGRSPPPLLLLCAYYRRGRQHRQREAAASAGAGPVLRLLQVQLPQGGVHRAELRAGRRAQGRRPRRRPPPPPLPRLLRPGLRRLRAPGRLRHRAGRAAGAAQPHAAPHRVQGHQRHPRPPPEGVRWRRRLLLRRPRARRPGLRRRGT